MHGSLHPQCSAEADAAAYLARLGLTGLSTTFRGACNRGVEAGTRPATPLWLLAWLACCDDTSEP